MNRDWLALIRHAEQCDAILEVSNPKEAAESIIKGSIRSSRLQYQQSKVFYKRTHLSQSKEGSRYSSTHSTVSPTSHERSQLNKKLVSDEQRKTTKKPSVSKQQIRYANGELKNISKRRSTASEQKSTDDELTNSNRTQSALTIEQTDIRKGVNMSSHTNTPERHPVLLNRYPVS